MAESGRGRNKSSETRHMVESSTEACSEAGVHPTVYNGVVAGMRHRKPVASEPQVRCS